jgi:hypothetical protein
MMDYWTRFSKSGVNGDPTLATAKKGKLIFEALVSNFVKLRAGISRLQVGPKWGGNNEAIAAEWAA